MRTSYKKILIASDGSDNSYLAFKEAVGIAICTQAQLFIIRVIDSRIDSFTPYIIDGTTEKQIEIAEGELEFLADEARKLGVSQVEVVVEQGQPRDIITSKFPKNNSIDLIIMGATEKSLLDKLWIGSTTSYVISHAACNVLIVRKEK